MASDFDDIFGDLKEDEQFSATLPSDFDEASIFGDSTATSTSSSSACKPQEVDKPTAGPGSNHDAVAQQQELPSSAPISEMVVAPAPAATMAAALSSAPSSAKPLWEQIGGTEQDDFLSWLDDGAEAPPSGSSPPQL